MWFCAFSCFQCVFFGPRVSILCHHSILCAIVCVSKFVLEHIFLKNPVGCLWICEAFLGRRPFCAPSLASLSIKRNWTLSYGTCYVGASRLLTKNHAWLGMFFLLWSAGGRLKNTGIFLNFCLNQSSWSYSHRITFRKYLLVIHLWWVNIIAAFSISSLNSIWESYMCPALGQTSGGRACTGNNWLRMRSWSSGDRTVWPPYLMHAFNKHGCV